MDGQRLDETIDNARERLLRARTDVGAFCGMLSSSALSTATATMALTMSAKAATDKGTGVSNQQRLATAGVDWLCANQNADGGWGDTVDSPSNISTTTLCWSCLGLADSPTKALQHVLQKADQWLDRECGGLSPEKLVATIRGKYGRDRTFSVPILTTAALGNRLGEDGWRHVPSLPFELATCPHRWFKRLGLRVVSYALPALIAIGQARHHHRPTRNPLTRVPRSLAKRRTLEILGQIQPESGGYLEAAPLTSFVVMSLVSMGLDQHPVTARGLGFLIDTVREDGSWPIDTNLDTWLSTLSINALNDSDEKTLAWLLDQQHTEEHPYTHAAPGGWAWTDLSGGVPDADDTASALIALRMCLDRAGAPGTRIRQAAHAGIQWLLDLQNADGGIPTFCRGWGKLPFDRSSPDLTAHALRAFAAWRGELPTREQRRINRATDRSVLYLLDNQREDGSFVPLWFGNQQETHQENPLIGTSRVLRAIAEVRPRASLHWAESGRRCVDWILRTQASDGGFGAAANLTPSIEETALAVDALAAWALAMRDAAPVDEEALSTAVERGMEWLIAQTGGGKHFDASPIGLYFAKLWYSERLYPLVFTVSALELGRRLLDTPAPTTLGESDPCLRTN